MVIYCEGCFFKVMIKCDNSTDNSFKGTILLLATWEGLSKNSNIYGTSGRGFF